MVQLLLSMILVAWLACQGTLGAPCRFANTAASQDSCVFPCRCTKGCNVMTGECINNGTCKEGIPSVFNWEGPACQKGNVAYNKAAEQSSDAPESRKFPAERAVDGITDSSMDNNHCAYAKTTSTANAWWTVDLGETHRIFSVVIYNRGDCCYQRLETFVLSVGESRDRSTHIPCGTHAGVVSAGGTVETTCEAVGRYVSFRRNGGHEPNIATLCEVVIIGYRYINCDLCTSACDDVTGCAECPSGKLQPDCVKACENGTYGVNCVEECGHCKDKSRCEATSGRCSSGCEMWYTSENCKSFIPIPHFQPSERPELSKITSSTAVTRWSAASNIPLGLETQYYYIVWLEAAGETERNVARVPHTADTDWFEAQVSGLAFNRRYSVNVKPYRQHKEEHQGGMRTEIASFKTSCIAPNIPVIKTVETPSAQASACANIVIKWQALNESGCDDLIAVGVWYKRQSVDEWSYRETARMNQTKLTIDYLTYEPYEVKVTATNNENVTATSEIVIANLQKSNGPGGNLLTAPVVGLVAGTFIFGVLCGGIAMLAVQRARRTKLKNLNKRTKRLPKVNFALENRAVTVEDEQCYMEPTQDENVYDDIGSYVTMKRPKE